ncbi:uncharacterized protein LOC135816575 [Sycon ciliatum]|uniref:uncharacterized protein LOC135816575 n=1 Tax=Sycon ciliatum TaxID=27933 RepID=UPI0031F607AD
MPSVTQHPFPLVCQNLYAKYACHLPHVSVPDDYDRTGVILIPFDPIGIYKFKCQFGYYAYCRKGEESCKTTNGAAAPFRSVGNGYTRFEFYNLPQCRKLESVTCAGVDFYYSATKHTSADAHRNCKSAGLQLANQALSKVRFNHKTMECLKAAPSTWISDNYVTQLSNKASPFSRQANTYPFVCIPLDFERKVNRGDLVLGHYADYECHGSQKLYYVANDQGETGRNLTRAQDACQERAAHLPGPSSRSCMFEMIKWLYSGHLCLKETNFVKIFECVRALRVSLQGGVAWIGSSRGSGPPGTSRTTHGHSYPVGSMLPVTICTTL